LIEDWATWSIAIAHWSRIGNFKRNPALLAQYFTTFPLINKSALVNPTDRNVESVTQMLCAISPTRSRSRVNLDHLFFIAMPSRAAFVIHWLGFIGWDFRRSGSLCEWYKFENSDRGSAKQDGLAGW